MKVAVVGCGNVSENHFDALSRIPDIQIVAAVDTVPEKADRKAAEYGARAYCDYEEMLASEHPDSVHIATPHYLHTAMALKALENGAHAFIEKPCSVSREEVRALRQAEQKYGRYVGVCFQNRYNNSSMMAKNLIDGGELGQVKAVRAFLTWDRGEDYYSDDWHGTADKECGGVLINQAIHTVDLVQYFGGGCRRLTAHISNDHLKGVIEVEDTAMVRMELNCGATGVLYATNAFSGNYDVMIEITLDKAVLRIEGEKLYMINPDGSYEMLCGKADMEFVGKTYWGHGHASIIGDFYDHLRNGRRFEIDSEEGGKAALIVAASYESAKINNTVEVE